MYNTGQTAVFLKDLTGREYPAIADVNRKKRVNGQREISLSFLYTEINKDFMDQLEFGWKVLFKGEWYTITHPGYSTDGNYFTVNVTAVLSFFVDLNGYFMQDKAEDKSITPAAYFGNLFQGTPFSYVLVDDFSANTVSYQDNESRTARFLYGIERFSAEYTVRGNVVYIYKLIGSDKDVILHEDLNINSVRMEVDASGFHTWAKGFGDLPEQEGDEEPEYQLQVEYVSPLAAKYGMIEGPAIKDGNYKSSESLTEAVKKQVENSYIVSSEIDAIDLTNNGYPEMVLEEGDRVWLYVNRLNLNQQVRVVEIDESFDWEGNIIAARYTAGNEGIAARYKSDQYDTFDDFDDITSGRKPIEYDWLPDAIKRASEIINGNQDSLFRYLPGEIIGINQSNPNGYMRFNTDGIGFSRDGGKTYRTAITYEGINADYIAAGTLRGIAVESKIDDYNYTIINGGYLESRGQYTRTWQGSTKEHDVALKFENGYFAARSLNDDRNLYYSNFGISTYASGNQNESSGTIEFFSYDYHPIRKGITISSVGGVVALRSGLERVILDAYDHAYLKSNQQQIRIQPRNHVVGNNTFAFHVVDNADPGEQDGIIYFGSENNPEWSSGLRFGKTLNSHTLYITDGTGARGTGDLEVYNLKVNNRMTGAIEAPADNAYAYVDNAFKVMNKSGSALRNLEVNNAIMNEVIFGSLRTADTESNTYIGTGSHELRVTNNQFYNGGNTVYRPVRASEYLNGSSLTYKTNIDDLSVSGLDIINNLEIKQYLLQSDVDNGIYDNWQVGVISELSPEVATSDRLAVNLYKMLGYAAKAIQEQSEEIKALKIRISDLEMIA